MTGRAAGLVVAAAALSLGAAALSAFAPSMPAGLAAACAPDLVLRELLAGVVVLVLLVAPSFLADEPGRPPECHGGLLAALPALPAAVALATAGGIDPLDLLPAAALVLACDVAASSWLRIDPSGRRGSLFAAAAAALLAGIPVAAYGVAEFGGWEGAAAAFRVSPLLAVRDVAGGWEAVGPATLLLVALAAVLRFAGLRRTVPAAALLLVLGAAPGDATVLVVGAPREGAYATLLSDLRGKGAVVREVDVLPGTVPWRVDTLVFARPPRSVEERAAWTVALGDLSRSGGRVFPWPGFPAPAAALPFIALPHPADRPDPAVDPGLFRVPFPVEPRSLPGGTFAFLVVANLAMAGTVLLGRRPAALAGVASVAAALLLLPGLRGEPFRTDLLVLEERVEGATSARRVEILRVERVLWGGTPPPPAAGFVEVRYAAGAAPAVLAEPGRYALFARVSGIEAPGPAEPYLAKIRLDGPPDAALGEWRRSADPRVSRAGSLLLHCLRPPEGTGPLLLAVPASGPDALVIHLPR